MTTDNLPAHISGDSDQQPSYRPTMSDNIDGETQYRPLQIKIMQPSTPEVAAQEIAGGIFASSLVGELGSSMTLVPLSQGAFRIMNNPTKEFGENEIVCMSPDAKNGTLNPESDYEQKDLAGRECVGCPFSLFTTDPKTKRRKAPLCTSNRTFAGYLPEHDLVGQITFRKTSSPAGEDIMSIVQQSKGFGRDAFALSLRLTKRGQYTYYVPLVRRLPIQDDWQEPIEQVKGILQIAGDQMAADAYAEAEADSGATFNSQSGFATSTEKEEKPRPRSKRERQTIDDTEVGDVKDIL